MITRQEFDALNKAVKEYASKVTGDSHNAERYANSVKMERALDKIARVLIESNKR